MAYEREHECTQPMHLWHMDSCDKLAEWGVHLHAGIDGASQYVLWTSVSTKKCQCATYAGFQSAVSRFGHPLQLRSVSEYNLLRADMESARHDVVRPYLCGLPSQDQGIKLWWSQLRSKVLSPYAKILTEMSGNGYDFGAGPVWDLDIRNPRHKNAFIAVFLPAIEESILHYVDVWNHHQVSPGQSPSSTFYAHERDPRRIHPPHLEDAREENDGGSECVATSSIEECAHQDEDHIDLEEPFLSIRNKAYALLLMSEEKSTPKVDLNILFNMHLLLTQECIYIAEEASNPTWEEIEEKLTTIRPRADVNPLTIELARQTACKFLRQAMHAMVQ